MITRSGRIIRIMQTSPEPVDTGSDHPSPLTLHRQMLAGIAAQDWDMLGQIVDVEGITENCVSLTPGWVTSFPTAVSEFHKNLGDVVSELTFSELDGAEDATSSTIRFVMEGRHTGPFLGVPPTGRRLRFEAMDYVKVINGRIGWRWVLIDLWGAYRQMTGAVPEPAPSE
jgi:predicted ester cyclase